jgi:excisionase family DNA binding protein
MAEITPLDGVRESPPPAPYLTVDEAAALARCNPKTIRRAFAAGRLRAFRPAHKVLLREDDVRAWVESQAAAEPVPPLTAGRSRSRRPVPGSVASLRALERDLG